ncbi:dihydroneopterin aldolase [Celeribacter neptunius]|uniref:dihydroneopterin aldolase n=1 Tax=Celeribacter neptunius TaxID=588602 RepID=A0A1I3J3H7_9RHOB|nr:dihydroneopterin aldolase [Celeribacter neptunius]SFI54730.1 dihydroneopterin aldolase [Celeribacter neptunius]
MSEIRQAFEHPETRAAATAAALPLDRISLRDHVVDVEIGAFQAERGTTQRVSFNIVVELTPISGPIEDDVDRILSYDRLTEAIHIELEAERLNLLETLAERIADRILLEPRAFRVFVRVEKLDRGPGALGVEIVRSVDQLDDPAAAAMGATAMQMAPHPLIVHLSQEALESPQLSAWIDALADDPRPVILTVGLPEGEWPKAGHKAAQRRIDLLAIEQNAWTLAARDPRCVVRASRTELDWAMKQGELSLWAPSKLVLDAVHGPRGGIAEMVQWLAAELSAAAVISLGNAGIEGAKIYAPDGPVDLAGS